MFYGTRGEVSARTSKFQKQLTRGKPVRELDFGPTMSTSDDPKARILLMRARSDWGSQFHPYYLYEVISSAFASGRLREATLEEFFAWSLEVP